MKRLTAILYGILATGCVTGTSPVWGQTPSFALVGFGAYSGTTTGGAGDTSPTTVTTGAQLQAAIDLAETAGPQIIYVSGVLTHSTGRVVIKDLANISIIGVCPFGELDSFGITIQRSSNIIIRNLKIHHIETDDKDAISIDQGSHHIWVDHNELFNDRDHDKDFYDGLCDIKHGSDFITVSWNYFHTHWKGSLVGHSDDNPLEDTGHLRVTYHHNFFDDLESRTPLNRFGNGHIYNNYFRNIYTTGSNSRMGACLRIERNVYENVDDPIISVDSVQDGFWDLGVDGNQFINCTGSQPTVSNCVNNIPYSFTTDYLPTNQVKNTVMTYAGVGKICGITPVNTPTRTNTFTMTRTYTFTPTRTNTPTFTSTRTATSTFSPTRTSTSTFTRTNTPVPPTSTFTSTRTNTSTFTSTRSNTATFSPTRTSTPTFTSTFSATRTFTSTFTSTSSNTSTRTFTSTATNTLSFTPTRTFTSTSTATLSSTSTRTSTSTSTATNTSTRTPTATLSATPSPTSSSTSTSTNTSSSTPTRTFTSTNTHTRSATPTASLTSTMTSTATSTSTHTSTATSTSSFTNTSTRTSTVTATSTSTATYTSTSTSTRTFTHTSTATLSNTATRTSTATLTSTATSTSTHSSTPTSTHSLTATATSTSTPTSSFTATSTATSTSTFTNSHTATNTYTATPTPTSTSTATLTASATSTSTPTRTASATSTPGQDVVVYPNPGTGPGPVTLQIRFPASAGEVKIVIFTTNFRKVNEITLHNVPAGVSQVPLGLTDRWGAPFANGIYYVVVRSPHGGRHVVKMMILR